MSSKPYAASGKYIERMSDYCQHCRYSVKDTSGPNACPFNVLYYWNFIAEHRDKLARNPRMAMLYTTLSRMPQARVERIRKHAQELLDVISAARVTDGASSN